MKTVDTSTYILMCFTFCMATFLIGLCLGGYVQTNEYRKSAIKAGVAKWVINDSENGGVEFIWVTEK